MGVDLIGKLLLGNDDLLRDSMSYEEKVREFGHDYTERSEG